MALLKKLMADPANVVTRASTKANAENLAPAFLAAIEERYGGTRLGRQEIEGEIVEDRAGALWTRAMIEDSRSAPPSGLIRIVVAVNPPAASHARADRCGIVAAGIDAEGYVHVLADGTVSAARPNEWATAAVALYHKLEADALIAEVNQGGDMVSAVIAEADASVPVTQVRASRSKFLRAAPVAMLYEQGRVRHCGAFPELEDDVRLLDRRAARRQESRPARCAGVGGFAARADAEGGRAAHAAGVSDAARAETDARGCAADADFRGRLMDIDRFGLSMMLSSLDKTVLVTSETAARIAQSVVRDVWGQAYLVGVSSRE